MRVTTLSKSKWDRKYASVWTIGAIDCYKRGCRCEGCAMREILETHCEMKKAVFELVKRFGAPTEKKEEKKVNEKTKMILEAIKNGAESYDDLYEMTDLPYTTIQTRLSMLYIEAKEKGLVFKNRKYKLPEYVKWVQKNENT